MQSKKLRDLIVTTLEELKAQEITALDVKKLTDITDYMIICSGTSSRHVHAMGKNLINKLKTQQIRPLGIEEEPNGSWTLVDFTDAVVHIMLPETRELYNLEKLWAVDRAKSQRTQE